jgi:hypothetical protein
MLHQIGDPRPLEYWVGRLFPEALIDRQGDKVQIVASDGGEMSPQLTEEELLTWLDGIETATRSGIGYDLIEQAGWVFPDEASFPDDKRSG